MTQHSERRERRKPKNLNKIVQKRLIGLLPPKEEIPSAISNIEAESLMARVSELEAEIARQGIVTKKPEHLLNVPHEKQRAIVLDSFDPEPVASEPDTQGSGFFQSVKKLWNVLTRAHPSLEHIGDRQQAQLASALSLGLAVLTAVGSVASVIANRGVEITGIVLVLVTVVVSSTYLLNRSRFYKLGSAVLVFGFLAAGYGLALMNPDHVSSSLFALIPEALVISSLLMPLWGLVTLTGVNFLIINLISFIVPAYSDSITDSGIYLTLGTLLVIAVAYRNRVESLRLGNLAAANKELENIQSNLEQMVTDRTRGLELAAEVGQTLTKKIGNLPELLADSVDLIRERFNLYHVQVYLSDAAGRHLTLRAGTGEAGRELLRRGHHLQIDSRSLNGRAAFERKTVIVSNTSKSPNFLANPLLPETRSEMVVPLIAGEQAIGVLDMQSEIPGTLNESNLPAFEALAGQFAIAIQNASLFDQTREAREQIEDNLRRITKQGWQDYLNSIDRSEKIGFVFDQNEIAPLSEFSESPSQDFLSVPIEIAGEEIGTFFTSEAERIWTAQEADILRTTVARLAEHIEGLRLLDQAEQYRDESEQLVRRLTQEGWDNTLAQEHSNHNFVYDQNIVKRVTQESSNGTSNGALKQAITVHDEPIGELIAEVADKSKNSEEIIAAVADRLSIHLETLRLAEELQQRAAELQELDRLKTAFLANMSHELRTPLNSILGFSDVILEELDGPLTDTMRNDLQLIQKNGNHLLHLINDVLDIAKIEAGKMNLNPEKFKVQEILQDVVNISSPQANDKGLSLAIHETSDHEIEIMADRTRIRQVLLNVVNNAIKFTDSGSVNLCVNHEGENALIIIQDTGEGIPADKLESIFQEFTQVDTTTTRKVGGTGLGLPISRRLIEIHGGHMWAESQGTEAGRGSIFFVELPIESKITDSIEVHEKES
jgi:signal transduction histidine kinase/putative methionine-R-sulfoxide reductase with GAF domain